MGNCFAMNQLVHPSDLHPSSSTVSNDSNRLPNTTLRIKVRLTTRLFKELMAKADLSKGETDIGHLIVKELWKGNCDARVVSSGNSGEDDAMKMSLETITEEQSYDFHD
ncbi:hypothetical protein BVC80_1719g43 [Macleaya cordata]|uniref:Uncharacterized protein n=1 Tax=Macleaya cordata TaxID=56857 RepID=A0A200Q2M3_MACCD|nr:hypothetical protein BVC80_1719g43 [Macleaya cordata]